MSYEESGFIGTVEEPIYFEIDNLFPEINPREQFKDVKIKDFKMLNIITSLDGVGKTRLLQSIRIFTNNCLNKNALVTSSLRNKPKFVIRLLSKGVESDSYEPKQHEHYTGYLERDNLNKELENFLFNDIEFDTNNFVEKKFISKYFEKCKNIFSNEINSFKSL